MVFYQSESREFDPSQHLHDSLGNLKLLPMTWSTVCECYFPRANGTLEGSLWMNGCEWVSAKFYNVKCFDSQTACCTRTARGTQVPISKNTLVCYPGSKIVEWALTSGQQKAYTSSGADWKLISFDSTSSNKMKRKEKEKHLNTNKGLAYQNVLAPWNLMYLYDSVFFKFVSSWSNALIVSRFG